MKFPLSWLNDYVDIKDEDLHKLAEKITKAGVNIEKIIDKRIDNLVIGQVLSVKKLKDSDHLNICLVDVGERQVQIVCGAEQF